MSSEWNDLERRLENLGSAVGDTGLPGPDAARQRAKQRSRRHAAGATLGAVAVLAGGTFAVAQFTGASTETPPADPTEQTTPPPTDERTEITDAASMRADDIVDWTTDGASLTAADLDWAASEPRAEPTECVPEATDVVNSARVDFEVAAESSEREPAHTSQSLYLANEGAGGDLLADLWAELEDCVSEPIDKSPIEGIGDDGWLIRYTYGEPVDEIFGWYVTVSLVRQDDAVSVVVKQELNTEAHLPPEIDTAANAAERMCQELFGTGCVADEPSLPDVDVNAYLEALPDQGEADGDPTDEPSEPDPGEPDQHVIADDPFLTEDQVNPVGDVGSGFTENPSYQANPPETWCLDDPNAVGADEVRQTYWAHEATAYVGETVLQFTDSNAADAWLRGYTSITDRCAAMGIPDYAEVTDEGLITTGSGDDALAWSVYYAPPDSGTSFMGAAVARRDNIGVILTFGDNAGPDGPGDWVGYVSERIGPALDNAIAPPP